MQQYIIRRVLLAIPTIIGITILIFMVLRVLPGDPLEQVFSEEQGLMVLSDEELGRRIVVQFLWDITSPIVLMFLWNWIMPGLFGLATIGYLKALGIVVMSRILFKHDSAQ